MLVLKTLSPGQNTFLVLFGSEAPSVVGFTLPVCKRVNVRFFWIRLFAAVSKACQVPPAAGRGSRTYLLLAGPAPRLRKTASALKVARAARLTGAKKRVLRARRRSAKAGRLRQARRKCTDHRKPALNLQPQLERGYRRGRQAAASLRHAHPFRQTHACTHVRTHERASLGARTECPRSGSACSPRPRLFRDFRPAGSAAILSFPRGPGLAVSARFRCSGSQTLGGKAEEWKPGLKFVP